MTRLRPLFFVPLIGLTWLIWSVRIRNLASTPTSADESMPATASWLVAVAFLVGATLLAAAIWRARGNALGGGEVSAIVAFVVITIAYWLIRAAQIALGDHSVAFVLVHTALASALIVSSGLALAAVLSGRVSRSVE